MATHIEYSSETELDEALDKILTLPEFLPLHDKVKVVGCFITRMDDDSQTLPGKGDPVALKKVAPEAHIFMRPKAHFILVVDYHWWTQGSDQVKQGKLIRALTRIKVETTETGLKIGTRPWDIQENMATIKMCGVYDEQLSMVKELLNHQQLAVAKAGIEKKLKTAPVEEKAAAKKPAARAAKPAEEESSEEERVRPARRVPMDSPPAPMAEPEPED